MKQKIRDDFKERMLDDWWRFVLSVANNHFVPPWIGLPVCSVSSSRAETPYYELLDATVDASITCWARVAAIIH